MGEPLEFDLSGVREDHAAGRGRLGDALADQHLPGPGVGGDPGARSRPLIACSAGHSRGHSTRPY